MAGRRYGRTQRTGRTRPAARRRNPRTRPAARRRNPRTRPAARRRNPRTRPAARGRNLQTIRGGRRRTSRRTHQHNFSRNVQRHWRQYAGPLVGTTGYRHKSNHTHNGGAPRLPNVPYRSGGAIGKKLRRGGRITNNNSGRFSGRTQTNPKGKFKK